MATSPADPAMQNFEAAQIMGGLYGDGIIGLKSAFTRQWADQMREDIETLFTEALATPGGVLPRGPERYYVETHPERLRGCIDIATHPWFIKVCEAVLGPEYKIVEAGFDIPGPGAADQPWHRDFPSPPATLIGRRLNSLAFNLTAVDTTPEMGPLEIAWGHSGTILAPTRTRCFRPGHFTRVTKSAWCANFLSGATFLRDRPSRFIGAPAIARSARARCL